MAATTQPRTVLERFPAGHPRGSWSADEYAAAQSAQGTAAWGSAARPTAPTPSAIAT